MGRQNWYYGNHPPACTCVRCNEGKVRKQAIPAHVLCTVVGFFKRLVFWVNAKWKFHNSISSFRERKKTYFKSFIFHWLFHRMFFCFFCLGIFSTFSTNFFDLDWFCGFFLYQSKICSGIRKSYFENHTI